MWHSTPSLDIRTAYNQFTFSRVTLLIKLRIQVCIPSPLPSRSSALVYVWLLYSSCLHYHLIFLLMGSVAMVILEYRPEYRPS